MRTRCFSAGNRLATTGACCPPKPGAPACSGAGPIATRPAKAPSSCRPAPAGNRNHLDPSINCIKLSPYKNHSKTIKQPETAIVNDPRGEWVGRTHEEIDTSPRHRRPGRHQHQVLRLRQPVDARPCWPAARPGAAHWPARVFRPAPPARRHRLRAAGQRRLAIDHGTVSLAGTSTKCCYSGSPLTLTRAGRLTVDPELQPPIR